MSRVSQTETRLAAFMPAEKARYKVMTLSRGVVFFVLGGLCLVGAFAFTILVMRETHGSPSVAVLIFAAIPAVAGAYFLFAGGHIISGEAMEAAGETGSIVARTAARALRLARPKV